MTEGEEKDASTEGTLPVCRDSAVRPPPDVDLLLHGQQRGHQVSGDMADSAEQSPCHDQDTRHLPAGQPGHTHQRLLAEAGPLAELVQEAAHSQDEGPPRPVWPRRS